MDNKKKPSNRSFSNFGFSTILIAFVMICVITFSALSMITANSDWNLSKKASERAKGYSIAEENAYDFLAEADATLASVYQSTSSEDEYLTKAQEELRNLSYFNTNQHAYQLNGVSGLTYDLIFPMDNYHTLNITMEIQYPSEKSDQFYKITKWQTTTDTSDYMNDEDTLNLMGN